MSEAEEVKLHIKVVVNKEKTKVLFVEAGRDFTDVLISFLVLPLGRIVKVLKKRYGEKAPIIGSLNTLYNSVANLDSIHFREVCYKQNLLNPVGSFDRELGNLRLNVDYTQPTSSSSEKPYSGVFTKSAAFFSIRDDLRLVPNTGSVMKTLSSLGIAVADMDGVETRDVAFGLNEIVALLKESLISESPLTALIFHGSQMNLETGGYGLLHKTDQNVTFNNFKKMILKVMLRKSTNELLFVQANYDFINFLFSMLTFSLGTVESFLGSNTGFKNIDILYRSIVYKQSKRTYDANEFSHVKEASTYMVSDDLTVAPLCITSCLSRLNGLKVSLSDVEELELQVGLKECLRIVNAALTSTTALTDGLIKPFLKKQARRDWTRDEDLSLSDVEEVNIEVGFEEGLSIMKAALTSTAALTDGLMKPSYIEEIT